MRRTIEDDRRISLVARIPSVIFGLLLIAALVVGAWRLGGPDAGAAALILSAYFAPVAGFARIARYLSASIALGAVCGLLAWRVIERGRWRDHVLAGLAYAALFHTHVATFVVLSATFAVFAPWAFLRDRSVAKPVVLGAIVALGVLPWILFSGFLEHFGRVPFAWSLLSVRDAFIGPLLFQRRLALIVLAATSLAVGALVLGGRLPARLRRHLPADRRLYSFLLVWIAAGYIGAPFLYPAVSYWMERVYLPLFPPAVLLTALLLSALARSAWERGSLLLACAGAVVLLWGSREGTLARAGPAPLCDRPAEEIAIHEAIEWLRERALPSDTRIYSTPNQHLAFMMYAGVPVQSIAPVRKSFLDSFESGIVIFECVRRYPPLRAPVIQEAAAAAGLRLSVEEADEWGLRLCVPPVREDLRGEVAEILPPPEPLPDWAQPLVERTRREAPRRIARSGDVRNGAFLFRGFELADFSSWWPIYFYRFSDPESRMGERLNYAERVRRGRATILRSSWVVYEASPEKD